MSLDQQFEAAQARLQTFTKRPTDAEFLDLYGLYKQAMFGDNNTSKPGMLDLKGKAKWEAWNGRKGMSNDDAKRAYVALVERLSASYT